MSENEEVPRNVVVLDKNSDRCLVCGAHALDAGWECNECGADNRDWYYPEWRLHTTEADK